MSLRTRLLAGIAVVAVVLIVASVAINRSTERNLIRQVDQQLERAVPQLRGNRRPPASGPNEGTGTGFQAPPSALYVAIVDEASGELIPVFVPNTTANLPASPDLTVVGVAARLGDGPFTVGANDGDLRYRAIVRTPARSSQTLVFALPLQDVDQSIRRLIAIQALAAAAILATLGLVTFWVLRLGVRPVQQMTARAKAIGQGDLSQRIPESAPGTEAGDLGLALNQMLSRIEHAFDEQSRSEGRLRQFVADASHELRTPVTTIRGYAELYRMGGLREEKALQEAMRRTEQEAARMGQLVADLLDLARLDQGRPLHLVLVDLAQLGADAAADARAVEPERPIDFDAPAPAFVLGDEAHLRQIVANLVTNARVHTPPGTPISVRVRKAEETVILEVQDDGPGMAPEIAAHAFERFYRADPARTRQTGGSGLGLSIVTSAVAAHHGSVALETAPGRGTTVRVTLPHRAAPPS